MFYISSRGSTATWWLTRSLSLHPDIVCFGATRSFPPIDPNLSYPAKNNWVKELNVEQFIEGLKICENATSGAKIFGSIHGFHGVEAKEACEKYNGTFLFMTRNPLERIHSNFITTVYNSLIKSKTDHPKTNKETHDFICKKMKNYNFKDINVKNFIEKEKTSAIKLYFKKNFSNSYKKLKEYKSYLNNIKKRKKTSNIVNSEDTIAEIFLSTLKDTFFYESELIKYCNVNQVIIMEEMFKSDIYFEKNILNKIFNGKTDKSYFLKLKKQTKINIHRDLPLKDFEIWNTWPISLKKIFYIYYKSFNMHNISKNFGYNLNFIN